MNKTWNITKNVLFGLFIGYIVIWSYIYLGILYAEHKEQKFYMVRRACSGLHGNAATTCSNIVMKYTVRANPLFYPIVY